jgi:murein DD-endopeptidase MepM/ murein hydrolase activator NlpD
MNKCTLIFIPQPQGSVHTLRLARWHISLFLAAACIFFVNLGLLAFTVTKVIQQHRELTGARVMLESQTEQIERFAAEMESLVGLETRVRDVVGLPPRRSAADNTRQGGQGGGEYPGYQMSELLRLPSLMNGHTAEARRLAVLLDEARYRQETFSELIDHVTREREQLAATPCIWPVNAPDAWISSGFGYRKDPINGKRTFHDGIDVVAPVKSPVLATADGVVTFAGWDGGLGWVVTIEHGHGYKTRYGHNHKLLVKKGDRVRRGDAIGLEGGTGRTTGPHVHYEVIHNGKKVNPYRYMVN